MKQFKILWIMLIVFMLTFSPTIALAGTSSSSKPSTSTSIKSSTPSSPSTSTSTPKSSIDLSKKSTATNPTKPSASISTPSTSNSVSKSIPSTSGSTSTTSSKYTPPINTTVTKKTFIGSTYSNGSSSSFHFGGAPYSYGYHPMFVPSWYNPFWYSPSYYMHPTPVVVTNGDFGFSFLIILIILGAIGYGGYRFIKRKKSAINHNDIKL